MQFSAFLFFLNNVTIYITAINNVASLLLHTVHGESRIDDAAYYLESFLEVVDKIEH